ncbi:methyltransferase domain-containing protein [Klebsiella michiganensis]
MTTNLNKLVSELPEIYQTIFGHPEWDGDAARDCNERLVLIGEQYDNLSRELGRPLRVLDLGCAQGFFSLSLASKGASVVGIDFQQENINVCQALAEENPEFDAKFQVGRIEEVIAALEENQFDFAIGLSVFHHIVHLHGVPEVKRLLQRLASHTQALILELAVKEEPLYWGNSQPADPRELIEQCAFYRLIGQFDTHLSPVPRPMYVISNQRVMLGDFNQPFQSWQDQPYAGAGFAHKRSRRYYFGDDFVCKLFYYNMPAGLLTEEESQRNKEELHNEAALLAHPPRGLKTPKLLAHDTNEQSGWLVMEKLPGRLLSDILAAGETVDREQILLSLLEALAKMEKQGLWHDDIRLWNVMVDQDRQALLIDFGSIVSAPQDCSWPVNIIQSFFIFVNELFGENRTWNGLWRSAPAHPFNLPKPWANWLYAVWQTPVASWNFVLLLKLFKEKDKLPDVGQNMSAVEQWIAAQETVLLEAQTRLRIENEHSTRLSAQIDALELQTSQLQHDLSVLHDTTAAFSVHDQELHWLAEHVDRLNGLLQQAAQQEEKEAPEPLQPPEIVALQQQLAAANREIHHLSNENHHLRHEIDKIHRSRSWRMTKWYRYAGLQIHLLRQYGFIQRCKHLIKRMLRGIFSILRKHPKIKHSAVNLLHKLGLYQPAYRLYRRMNPLPHSQYQAEATILSQTEMQVMHPELLPPAVHEIYLKLTKNK